MGILHILHNFPPEFTGGTERYVLGLCEAQKKEGLDPTVLCGSEKVLADGPVTPFTHNGIPCIRVHRSPSEPYSILPRHPRILENIREEVARLKPRVIHLHHWFHLDPGLVAALSRDKYPIVVTLHDFFPLCPRFFRIRPGDHPPCPADQDLRLCDPCLEPEAQGDSQSRLEELQVRSQLFAEELRLAKEVIVMSKAVRDFYSKWPPLPSRSLQLLPPGIPGELLWQKSAAPAAREGLIKIGYWGGICRAKGLDLLVEALSRVGLSGKTQLHLFGPEIEKDFVQEIQAQAKKGKLKIHFHGPIAPQRLPQRTADLSLAVFPSHCFETYGLSVDEALLQGLPVVVPNLGALPERLGKSGLTYEPGDPNDLARSIKEILFSGDGSSPWRNRTHKVPLFHDHITALTGLYSRACR